ncbi:helix-turn-helix transcriptional regulator [Alkalimarinus alittae]|uniref:WYL domain-containing protein n=1 Tax=Alkalimarinus alittae TaxID=2961619 RepID=A0ABY6MX92_9ALTE|nr:WYL domain-containing protein [Alkalimarinus alittae]UZE94425.1 WYL domain-containing protein [Alkalimarinus alittae]
MSSALRKLLLLRYIPREPKSVFTSTLHTKINNEGYAVSERTIQRDLEELSLLFSLSSDETSKPYKWFFPHDTAVIDIPGMSPQIALTFLLVKKFASNSFPSSVLENLTPYFAQAEKELGSSNDNPLAQWPGKVEAISDGMTFQPPSIKPEVIDAVYDGLLHNKCIEGQYTPRVGGVSKYYKIHPLGLVYRGAVIYLVCTLWEYNDIVQLALHRFDSVQLDDIDRSQPADFDLKRYVDKGGFGILNNEEQIAFVGKFQMMKGKHLFETPLSIDQVIESETDDSFILKATVPNTQHFLWWLMSFGEKVEVLEPDWLRAKMIETASAVVALYSQ